MWGFLNALYIMPSIILNTHRNNLDIVAKGKYLPSLKEAASIIFTFMFAVFAWIFFRAENMTHAFTYIAGIFSWSSLSKPFVFPTVFVVLITLFMIVDWLGREKQYALQITESITKPFARIIFYYCIIGSILYFGNFNENQFIYFQF